VGGLSRLLAPLTRLSVPAASKATGSNSVESRHDSARYLLPRVPDSPYYCAAQDSWSTFQPAVYVHSIIFSSCEHDVHDACAARPQVSQDTCCRSHICQSAGHCQLQTVNCKTGLPTRWPAIHDHGPWICRVGSDPAHPPYSRRRVVLGLDRLSGTCYMRKVPGRDLSHGRKRCIGLAQSREATLGEHSAAPEGVVMHV
jgi:hypothetical protein